MGAGRGIEEARFSRVLALVLARGSRDRDRDRGCDCGCGCDAGNEDEKSGGEGRGWAQAWKAEVVWIKYQIPVFVGQRKREAPPTDSQGNHL